MIGHLQLVYGCRYGRTVLVEQSFRAPIHLSKTYWDGRYLLVNAVNSTAGYFPGDSIEISVLAQTGSAGVLTSPSASRFFRSDRADRDVVINQRIQIQSSAWLDVFPEVLIPHAGSRSEQQTTLEVADGGELFYLESLAPGRVAAGESFAFQSLRWKTKLLVEGRLISQERLSLKPTDGSLRGLQTHFPDSYHASGLVVSPRLPGNHALLHSIAELASERVFLGASMLGEGVMTVRVLAADAVALRRAISEVRRLVYLAIQRVEPGLRKL